MRKVIFTVNIEVTTLESAKFRRYMTSAFVARSAGNRGNFAARLLGKIAERLIDYLVVYLTHNNGKEINVRGCEMYVNNGTETESAIPRIALRINFILK